MEISYLIPIDGIKVSTNKIYAGVHWAQRKKIKDSILDSAAGFCKPIQGVRSYPVEISYQFFFRSRGLDTLNCAYMAKMFEDSLHTLGVIADDSPKYVKKSSIEVIEIPRQKTKKKADDLGKKKSKENGDYLIIKIKENA